MIFGTVFAVINSGNLSITKNIEGEILNEKNNCGLVTWNMDLDAAAQKIANFIADSELYRLAAANAKRLANTQFHRDMLAEQLNQVLINTVNASSITPESVTQEYYD